MMKARELQEEAVADARAGARLSAEDLAIAALVVAPFTLALVLLVGWIAPLPSLLLQLVWLALTGAAGFWNAGWRARTSA
jgi:hypothetical protein